MNFISSGCYSTEKFHEWGRLLFLPSDIAIVLFCSVQEVVNELIDSTSVYAKAYREGVQQAISAIQEKMFYEAELPFEQVKFYDEKLAFFTLRLNTQLSQ